MFGMRAIFSLYCIELVGADCYIFPTIKILIKRHQFSSKVHYPVRTKEFLFNSLVYC